MTTATNEISELQRRSDLLGNDRTLTPDRVSMLDDALRMVGDILSESPMLIDAFRAQWDIISRASAADAAKKDLPFFVSERLDRLNRGLAAAAEARRELDAEIQASINERRYHTQRLGHDIGTLVDPTRKAMRDLLWVLSGSNRGYSDYTAPTYSLS